MADPTITAQPLTDPHTGPGDSGIINQNMQNNGGVYNPNPNTQGNPGTTTGIDTLGSQATTNTGPQGAPATSSSVLNPVNTNLPTPPTLTSSTYTGSPTQGVTDQQNQYIQNLEQQQASNPAMPSTAVVNPTLLNDTTNTELQSPGSQVQGNLSQQAQQGQVTTTNPNQFSAQAGNYTAAQAGAAQATANQAQQTAPVQAATGQVTSGDTVAGQMQQLTQNTNIQNGQAPAWAAPTVAAVESQLAARGLGGSSIAAGAITSAIYGAALPIAQADAGANMQMALANMNNTQAANLANANLSLQTNLANLNAEQQTSLQNVQNQQASLLSDQAAENAAQQFNATNQQQVSEFMANMASTIAMQNASAANSMAQFNAGQANSMSQFNANLDNSRQQFNANNQLQIDQSNVQWRRTINTSNTAAINAANQTNAQNLFNLSSQAQNNLWQQWRDEATWANTDQQNADTRATNMAIAALGSQTAYGLNSQIANNQMYQQLGQFGINLFNNLISNTFGSSA